MRQCEQPPVLTEEINEELKISTAKMIQVLERFIQYRKKVYELRKKFEMAAVKKTIAVENLDASHLTIHEMLDEHIQKDTLRQITYYEFSDSRFSIVLLEER